MAINKTQNASDAYIEKRISSFQAQGKAPKIFILSHSTESLTEVWTTIKYHLDQNNCYVDTLISNIYKIVSYSSNIVLQPLVDQIAYTNLTAIMMIAESLTKISDFPWAGLAAKMPAIEAELLKFAELIKVFEKDKYVGLVINGCSREFPNLAYLAIQLQILVLNNITLGKYKGPGSITNTVGINQKYLDSLIKDYLDDKTKSLGSYAELKGITEENQAYITAGKIISGYIGGGDNDKNDPGSPPPSPPPSPGGPSNAPSAPLEESEPTQSPKGLYPGLDPLFMELGEEIAPIGSPKRSIGDAGLTPDPKIPRTGSSPTVESRLSSEFGVVSLIQNKTFKKMSAEAATLLATESEKRKFHKDRVAITYDIASRGHLYLHSMLRVIDNDILNIDFKDLSSITIVDRLKLIHGNDNVEAVSLLMTEI